ncbi:MAG: transposase [Planctomycetaceae bacterium]|nr:transposase [Planctomycetaceae bacterium]
MIPVHTVGRPRTIEMRQVLNAIFYLNRSGCQWDMLPHDLPPRSTVHAYYTESGNFVRSCSTDCVDCAR